MTRWYEFRDAVHGFILVSDVERSVIDTRAFQRLRHIAQLGTTSLVYPSANHTRFEHSIGTLHVAQTMYELVVLKHQNVLRELGWQDEDIETNGRILRLAALLHDLGHCPFSHATEALLPKGHEHEDYTFQAIVNSEVGETLRRNGLSGQEIEAVAEVASETATNSNLIFLKELIAGELGADRIDYLLRDSHHAGVRYGVFDHQRLLHTILITKEPVLESQSPVKYAPQICLEEGGAHAGVGLFLARYFMTLQVYSHRTRRILDLHLKEFLKKYASLPEGTWPSDVSQFLEWDDLRVYALFRDRRETEECRRLLEREFFREADATTDHADRAELVLFAWLWEKVAEQHGDTVRLDDEGPARTENYVRPDIRVRMETGPGAGGFRPLSDYSPVLRDLRAIKKLRIYAHPDRKSDVEQLCRQFRAERS